MYVLSLKYKSLFFTLILLIFTPKNGLALDSNPRDGSIALNNNVCSEVLNVYENTTSENRNLTRLSSTSKLLNQLTPNFLYFKPTVMVEGQEVNLSEAVSSSTFNLLKKYPHLLSHFQLLELFSPWSRNSQGLRRYQSERLKAKTLNLDMTVGAFGKELILKLSPRLNGERTTPILFLKHIQKTIESYPYRTIYGEYVVQILLARLNLQLSQATSIEAKEREISFEMGFDVQNATHMRVLKHLIDHI